MGVAAPVPSPMPRPATLLRTLKLSSLDAVEIGLLEIESRNTAHGSKLAKFIIPGGNTLPLFDRVATWGQKCRGRMR